MLNFMRRQRSSLKWVLVVIIVALGGSMVIGFIPFGDLGSVSITNDVAKVGSETVTAAEFQTTYSNYVRNMQQQLTPEIRKAFGFDRQILDYLISQKVIMAEAKRLGLQVSDQEVAQAVLTNQAFQSGGTFIGKDRYEALLLQNGINAEQFEGTLRNEIIVGKVMSFVTAGVSVNDKDVETEYRKRNEKAVLNYFLVDPAKLESKVALNDQDLKDYYEKNKARYNVPEKRKSRYAYVDIIKYRIAAKTDDVELKAYYDEHAEEYRLPQEITAQHVFFKTPDTKAEAIEAVRKKASGVLDRAKKGEDFAKLATEFSEDASAKIGGNLGTLQRSGKFGAGFDEAAFALGPGAISDLVQTPGGFHIIKVNAKQDGRLRTFEEIKESIRPLILFRKGSEEAKKVADQIAADLAKTPDMNAVAAKHGATVKETALLEQSGAIPELGNYPPYQMAVFSLAKDGIGSPLEVLNGFAIPQVTEIQAAHPASLDEAKAKVTTDAKSEKARQMAAETSAKIQEQITAGKADLATLAKTAGVEIKTSEKIARSGSLPEFGSISERDQDIFSLPLGKVGPSTTLGGKTLVFSVKEREDIKVEEMNKSKDTLRAELLNSKREKYFSAYIKEIQKKMEEAKTISINEGVMTQIAESIQ
jgi:peptidyl-prolyl cis-trans isomerase D